MSLKDMLADVKARNAALRAAAGPFLPEEFMSRLEEADALQSEFGTLHRKAVEGDEDALKALPDAARALLDKTRSLVE